MIYRIHDKRNKYKGCVWNFPRTPFMFNIMWHFECKEIYLISSLELIKITCNIVVGRKNFIFIWVKFILNKISLIGGHINFWWIEWVMWLNTQYCVIPSWTHQLIVLGLSFDALKLRTLVIFTLNRWQSVITNLRVWLVLDVLLLYAK